MRAARLVLLLAIASWLALLLAAPAAVFGVPLSGVTYAFASIVCHQRPERSFHLGLAQLPVCARCFGLYLGAAAGALAALQGCDAIRGTIASRATLRAVLIVAAVPTAITWGSEVAGLWAFGNVTRSLAALPLGTAVAVTVNYVGCAPLLRPEPRAPRTPI